MMYRITLLLAFIALPLRAADPLGLAVPGVDGNVFATTKASTIEIVATNGESHAPLRFTWISVERRGGDGKFAVFRVDIQCECDAMCKKSPVSLEYGASLRATWDLRSSDCQNAGQGVYRIAVIDRYSDATSGYVYHGVSKEFTILE